jgi:NADH-quinone oxidoreductase subunit M
MLTVLIFFPLVAGCITACTGKNAARTAFAFSFIEFILVLVVAFRFVPSGGMQFSAMYEWIPSLGISYHVALDGISLLLVLLTAFLVPLIILSSFRRQYKNPALFYSLILIMQFALTGVFSALDGFLFYVFWELALIPIYLICLIWGGSGRLRITLKFFIYTLSGSLLMLVAFIWLWLQTPGAHTFDIQAFYSLHLTTSEQSWIFWALFLAFAIKMPVFPFHTWQPDTYVDSPAQGTMLLSGIMLKMGVYGVIRWMLPVVPGGVQQWGLTVVVLSVIGIVYASCIAIVQKDFKRMIAYSSIAHVGLISAGIFSLSYQGLQGGIIQMVTHGINVVGLFFIADIIAQRMETEEMNSLGGIRNHAPQFATMFMIIMLASVALPLTNGFVGEFLLINGIYQYDAVIAAIAGLTIILGAVYMLRAYQKISLGEANSLTMQFPDLTFNEKCVLVPLVIMIFWIGLYPNTLLDIAAPSVEALRRSISQSAFTSILQVH